MVPSWVPVIPLGGWYEIPNTNLASVDPSPAVSPAGEGPSAKVNDWNSFALDYRTSDLLSVANGGHAGYWGNEVDRLRLETETPAWEQILAPSANADIIDCSSYYADGRPTSRHTYYCSVFSELAGRVMLFGGAWACTGGGWHYKNDHYDIGTNTYSVSGDHPGNGSAFGDTVFAPTGSGVFCDQTTGNIYSQQFQRIGRWNRAANTITNNLGATGDAIPANDNQPAAFDSLRRRGVFLGGSGAGFGHYNVDTNVYTSITKTGANASDVAGTEHAMFYVPALDVFLYRKAAAGGTVYQINASTFECTTYPTTGGGSIPLSGVGNGPFSRMLYVPNLGGAIYYPAYGGNAWFLRTNVVAAPRTISGTVDSSLVDRHQPTNFVYAFNGFNTTTGTPAATIAITQDVNACTFRYSMPNISDGDYTIAVTRDGGSTFNRQANVTVNGDEVQNFTAISVIQVGPGRTYTNPNAVIGVAVSGDVIEIDAGTYTAVQGVWTQNKLTFRGVGGLAHVVAPGTITNDKAIWVTQGTDTRIENIEFSGAVVTDHNGCGIRIEGADIAIACSYFHDNEGGLLGNDGAGYILVEYSEFDTEGNCIDVNACSHHVYFGKNTRVIMQHNYLHDAFEGHLVKSRAQENRILYNRIMDEATGQSSYQIDLPNGGLSYIIGNLVQKGPASLNSGTMVNYGEDGFGTQSKQLYVINNTFVNDLGSNLVVFIQVAGAANSAVIENNLFVEMDTIASGPNTQTTNTQTTTPNLVDRVGFNYRPTVNTPGRNGGTAPGTGSGLDMTPIYQYLHPANRENRPISAGLDIGAYEFESGGGLVSPNVQRSRRMISLVSGR